MPQDVPATTQTTESAPVRVAREADLFALPARAFGEVLVPAGPNGDLMTVKVQSMTQEEYDQAQSLRSTTKITKDKDGKARAAIDLTPHRYNAYILYAGMLEPDLPEDKCRLLLKRSPAMVNPIIDKILALSGINATVDEVATEEEQFQDESGTAA